MHVQELKAETRPKADLHACSMSYENSSVTETLAVTSILTPLKGADTLDPSRAAHINVQTPEEALIRTANLLYSYQHTRLSINPYETDYNFCEEIFISI